MSLCFLFEGFVCFLKGFCKDLDFVLVEVVDV